MTDINGLNTASGLNIPKLGSTIVMAARAFGLEAIDTPYLKVHDTEGFRREVAVSRDMASQDALFFTLVKSRLLMPPSRPRKMRSMRLRK